LNDGKVGSMKTQSPDTSIEAEKQLISLIRKKTASEKFRQICSLSQTAVLLAKRAIARANPNFTEQDIGLEFIRIHYGKQLAERVAEYMKRRKDEKPADRSSTKTGHPVS
jgi:hypothetical protein